MKTTFLLSLLAILFFVSCKDSNKETKTAVTPGMMELIIKINDNPLSIMVPDSTIGPLKVIQQSWGATEIKVGKGFQITISEDEGDVTLKKSDIKADEVNKFKTFIKEEPATLFWESAITEPEFHFYTVEKAGALFYTIEDIREINFNQREIQTMIEAAKSMKPAEKVKS